MFDVYSLTVTLEPPKRGATAERLGGPGLPGEGPGIAAVRNAG